MMKNINIPKRLFACLLLILLLCTLPSCTASDKQSGLKDKETETSDTEKEKDKTKESESNYIPEVDILPIQSAMLDAAPSLPEMTTVNSNDTDAEYSFAYLSEIGYEKVDSYFLSFADTPVADEIAVVRMRSGEDTKDMKKSLEKHLSDRISLFSTYAKDELARLEAAEIFTEGNYAVLIICDDSRAVKDAFIKAIS